jgi:hypothetical protein
MLVWHGNYPFVLCLVLYGVQHLYCLVFGEHLEDVQHFIGSY